MVAASDVESRWRVHFWIGAACKADKAGAAAAFVVHRHHNVQSIWATRTSDGGRFFNRCSSRGSYRPKAARRTTGRSKATSRQHSVRPRRGAPRDSISEILSPRFYLRDPFEILSPRFYLRDPFELTLGVGSQRAALMSGGHFPLSTFHFPLPTFHFPLSAQVRRRRGRRP